MSVEHPPGVLLETNACDTVNLCVTLRDEPCRRFEVLPRVHPRAAQEHLLRRRNEPRTHFERLNEKKKCEIFINILFKALKSILVIHIRSI